MNIKHIVAIVLAIVAGVGSQELFARGGGGGGHGGGGGGHGGGGFGGGGHGGGGFGGGGRGGGGRGGTVTARSVSGSRMSSGRVGTHSVGRGGSRVGARGTTGRAGTRAGARGTGRAGGRSGLARGGAARGRFGSGRQFGGRGWSNWGRFGFWGWGPFGWGWWLGWGIGFWPWSPWWIYDDECCGITVVADPIPDTVYVEAPEDAKGWGQLQEQLDASNKDLDELDRRIARIKTKISAEEDEVATKVDKQQLKTLRDTRKKVKTYVDKLEEVQQQRGATTINEKIKGGAEDDEVTYARKLKPVRDTRTEVKSYYGGKRLDKMHQRRRAATTVSDEYEE